MIYSSQLTIIIFFLKVLNISAIGLIIKLEFQLIKVEFPAERSILIKPIADILRTFKTTINLVYHYFTHTCFTLITPPTCIAVHV